MRCWRSDCAGWAAYTALFQQTCRPLQAKVNVRARRSSCSAPALHSPVHLLVTAPSEADDKGFSAATDRTSGVEALRINCAHVDNPDIWAKMIEQA